MSDVTGPTTRRGDVPSTPTSVVEVAVAVVTFLALCLVVLVRNPQLLEPDDYAYRASIVALSQGHVLLTNAQYLALKTKLSLQGGPGIEQWVRLTSGKWISQKNPGYPYFAVVFQWLHALRAAPLFYGGAACIGLFYGGRKWLGAWGGVYAMALFCFSGAALIFAWRSTMPTFTDASLIAGATGLLLGVMLARDDSPEKRFLLGALAFLALDGATFIRYTDVVVLVVALVVTVVFARVCQVRGSTVLGWLVIVLLFSAGDLWVNHVLYGGVFTTGYESGVVSFRLSAIVPNLERMPPRLLESMPMVLLALVSVVWIVIRAALSRGASSHVRRDAAVAVALGIGWVSVWALYSAYTWTVDQTIGPGNPIHVVRFYVPVVGLIALLGAWLLKHLGGWVPVALVAVIVGLALWSYVTPSNDIIVGPERPTPTPAVSRPGPPARATIHLHPVDATAIRAA